MEEIKISEITTDVSVWEPTIQLRWKHAKYNDNNVYGIKEIVAGGESSVFVLQQLWRSQDGKTEWRDIEIEWKPKTDMI